MTANADENVTIVLIGPDDEAGDAVGELLATQLGKPLVDLWEEAPHYWKEIGYKENRERQAWETDKADGVYQYLMPFAAHSIKRGVDEHRHSVIKLGVLQSIFDNDELLETVTQCLSPVDVVLLLPSNDTEQCLNVIRQRHADIVDGKEMNEHFLTHRSNGELAKHCVYTRNKSPEQTAADVLACIDPTVSEIILIGAQGVGKSTIGELLAKQLNIPQISMDKLRWRYYEEKGWSREQQERIHKKDGFSGVYRYWKQFDLHAVERIFKEHDHCVIDLGAGHSVYEQPADLARARELFAPYANVVLLMPSPDVDESVATLRKRRVMTIDGQELLEFVINHRSNSLLADYTVFTDGRTPGETTADILRRLAAASSAQVPVPHPDGLRPDVEQQN